MNWQSDFVSPHINTNGTQYSKNTTGVPNTVVPNSTQNLFMNSAANSNSFRLMNTSTLTSASIPSFSNLTQYNHALMSSSVPQFTLNHDLSTSTLPVQIVNNNFQFSNLHQTSKNLVNQVIDSLRRSKVKLVAFDFDCTIVSVHTGGQWMESAEKLADFVRPCFRELLSVLLKLNDFYVCVVTYSPQEELIREVLRISLKDEYNINELIKKIVIKGNTREFVEEHGIESCYSNGKQIHLKFCRSIYDQMSKRLNIDNRVNNENVLLIDDDLQNLRIANENGHLAYQVNNSVSLVDFLNFLKDK